MLLEATGKPIKYRLNDGRELLLEPGVPVEIPDDAARRVLLKAGAKVRIAALSPLPPLQSGWLVVYRDHNGRLCGGYDDRAHGTVAQCEWTGTEWEVILTDGHRLPLKVVRAVTQMAVNGEILGAWLVEEHGYDGQGR